MTPIEIEGIIWAMIAGFAVSFFAMYYKRRVIGSFVRALREAGADSPETAKTLAELEQEHNVSVISNLKKSASLRRMITIYNEETETEDPNPKKGNESIKIDENTRFYIAPEAITRSRVQYGDNPEPLWPILLGCAGLVVIGVLACMIIQ